MLSDRRQRVLCALIEEYIRHAMPVGSRTLTERYSLGVSPATVRNDLSALEEGGFIFQPHTSAGRVPTDFGYRAFVDDLLENDLLQEENPYPEVVSQLRQRAQELDELMEQTSEALMRLTNCLSIVVAPSLLSARIRQISLISLSPRRVLLVVVSQDGEVLNRQIGFEEDVDVQDLAKVQNLMNMTFSGKTLDDMGTEVQEDMFASVHDPLFQVMLEELIVCVRESDDGRSRRTGLSSLMAMPEFSSSSSLVPLMRLMEHEDVLCSALDGAEGEDGQCLVRIGAENPIPELSDVSVVAGRYGRGESAGIVAVIGPTRMDYGSVIRAVRAAQQALADD